MCLWPSRRAVTSFMASRKSAAVAQLEPIMSISFSGKAPGLIGAGPDDMPTTTTRPAAATSSAAWGRTPATPLVSTTRGGPSCLVQSWIWSLSSAAGAQVTTSAPSRLARSRLVWLRVDGQHPGACVYRRQQRGQADRAGAEDHELLARLKPGASQGVHGDRGGLDEGRAIRVEVTDHEDQPGRDLEPFGQPAVEVHADQPEPYADVGAVDAAGIAVAARQQRPDRDPVAFVYAVGVSGVFHDRGHLVTLDARIEVAGAGKRGHVTGKQVEVRAADTDGFWPHDNVPGAGAARSGNVLDHHLAR